MITPENKIPQDDSNTNESDDQQSQKDIHSNGLEEIDQTNETQDVDTASLQQAYDAAEASFTLAAEKGIEEDNSDEKSNVKS